MTFLDKLPKQFTALAPMEDVTDTVFRQVVAACGKPDIFFAEFVSVDGLFSAGHDVVAQRLKFTPQEQPIVAQLWGKDPEKFLRAAKYIAELGFAGVDINMGCPVPKVVKTGCGAALIEQPTLAKEIFCAVREGAGDIAVSIKTRIGFRERDTEKWCGFLLTLKPDLLTLHGRTAKEMYRYSADWSEIAKVVEMRNQMGSNTLIMGNGDVVDYHDIQHRFETYGVDGVMLGRAILQNPFAFNTNRIELSPEKRIAMLIEHIQLFLETWSTTKNFSELKKYFKTYISNMPAAPTLRGALMQTNSLEEVKAVIEKWHAKKL